jgi:hypothetical protein
LTYMQNVATSKHDKLITHLFLDKKRIFGWWNTNLILNVCVNLNAFEDQNRYVWITLQIIENGSDLDFFIGCNLFKFYAKCSTKKTWQNDYSLFMVQN